MLEVIMMFIMMFALVGIVEGILRSMANNPDKEFEQPPEKKCPPHAWEYVQNKFGETRVTCGTCHYTVGDGSNDAV